MESRTHNINHSKRFECQPGDCIVGCFNTIICNGGPIKVDGSHNKIHTNFSQLYGSFNKVYGIGNTLYGSHNKAIGQDNNCIGSFNKTIYNQIRTPQPLTKSEKSTNIVDRTSPSSHVTTCVGSVGTNAVTHISGNSSSSSSTPTVYTMGFGGITMDTSGRLNSFASLLENNRGASCIMIQAANPKPALSTITAPSFPTADELRYDEEAAEEEDDANICVICLARKRKCVIRPCKHFSLCVACSKNTLDKCPVCRKEITAIERLFV